MKVSPRVAWLALLLIPLSFGLARLEFNVEILDLLPDDLPAVRGLKLYQQHFANTRELVITLEHDDPDRTETAAASLADHLSAHPQLEASVAWHPPWQQQPEHAAALVALAWLNQPPEAWTNLMRRLEPEQLDHWLEDARHRLATSLSPLEIARIAYDPFELSVLPLDPAHDVHVFQSGRDLFASADGAFRLLYVQAPATLDNYRACVQWFDRIRDTVVVWHGDQPDSDALRIGYTGQPAFMAEIGGGMERDMTRSVVTTAMAIAILFGLVHRRILPLLWLLLLLAFILALTLAIAGLLLGSLNIVSVGFAAILLGLAADYALVLYQESRVQPHADSVTLRRQLAPGILWAAITTGAAFLALTLSQLPGLAQLGALVTLGVLLGAVIMLGVFLPPLLATGRVDPSHDNAVPKPAATGQTVVGGHLDSSTAGRSGAMRIPWMTTAALLLGAGAILLFAGAPMLDHGPGALRPRHSAAYETLERIKERMNRPSEPLWLLVGGPDDARVAVRLEQLRGPLEAALRTGSIDGFNLPTLFWPNPGHQTGNRIQIQSLLEREPALAEALDRQGFTEQAGRFTRSVFDVWRQALSSPGPFLPAHPEIRWLVNQLVSRAGTNRFALGLIHPAVDPVTLHSQLSPEIEDAQTWLTSWAILGSRVFDRVRTEWLWITTVMLVLLMAALSLAFRRSGEVILSFCTLAFSLLCLLAVMAIAGWSWNLMNLMAIPLLLGTTVDYSIHIQLALRRHRGNLANVRLGTGRALLLCGATTFTAFASLGWSGNAGLAGLGQVCAAGMACATVTAVFLLPAWWCYATRNRPPSSATPGPLSSHPNPIPDKPSRLYRADLWRLALITVRFLPPPLCNVIGRNAASLARILRPARHRVVLHNLLPVLNHDLARAEQATRSLFRQFGVKLADLWRFESGQSVDDLVGDLLGGDQFFAALESGRGVLLVTPHLGNWEFGAPLLSRHGIQLLALTMEEPDAPLTEMRRSSRARWGIETIVVQRNPFAFLEVIRRLEQGAVVALLIDRPPPPTAVPVELFGRPFLASIAPAELARASNCMILPVTVIRHKQRYSASVLPEIVYDRASLRAPEARQRLTREILRAFEPAIRQHPDQWYHFVPIWP